MWTDAAQIRRLEGVAARSWPAVEGEALDGWHLRADPVASRRLNSVLALGFRPSTDLDAAIGRVEAWYALRGRPARYCLSGASLPKGLDAALDDRGYTRVAPTRVMLRRPEAPLPLADPPPGITLDLATRPTPGVTAAMSDAFADPAERRARAALYARIKGTRAFVVARAGDGCLGGALGVVRDGHLGVFALRVERAARRRGLGAALLGRLLHYAHDFAVDAVYLQVQADNAAGAALFARTGFGPVYGYHYREVPPT